MTATSKPDEVRTIDSGQNPTRFARGWHCLGVARAFQDGQPHEIKAFGTTLVVFMSESDGKLNVLDAYCRHMGGNLAHGTVKGDSIACPFHDWRWGGNGRCTAIPYARRVPPLARTRAWVTLERNGLLFVWNDPQGNPPPDNVTIPHINGYGSSEWTEWSWNSTLIEGSNCREVIDNLVDMAHFFYVHYNMPTYFKNVFEGQVATQYMGSVPRRDVTAGTTYDGDTELDSWASYYGPSFMMNGQKLMVEGQEIEGMLINCHYPVTPDSFVLQYGAIVKKRPDVPDDIAQQTATAFADSLETVFLQDVPIWRHKTRIDNPLLCEEDGPVYQLRRWYQQFYVDVEDITPDMTNRYEFEVDVTRAVQAWEAEVADNIAQGRTLDMSGANNA
ncbi:Rieske 2Fe-2S domain-containing protein [Nocardia donostiensis]|uniref:Rieske-type oxygenase n=1 Tax=Nocardia donostiensis TaxID=1538463 RepID=A0A1W0ARH3_9NOCA|nr:Rieske 2Fe-2S domain-containing protein [Nocardia donostiensis]ONM46034.1 3-ketosteroid-9-alpha-hydroxylase [Nocardia donostiensis]OQS12833.1 3-ketosteroid-9-alpha-hydroxylase [Nocardia donostiensis]OQS17742.1 3-ketosteroid-9-alpha-hydroxylase [Nocardia donostiensis]